MSVYACTRQSWRDGEHAGLCVCVNLPENMTCSNRITRALLAEWHQRARVAVHHQRRLPAYIHVLVSGCSSTHTHTHRSVYPPHATSRYCQWYMRIQSSAYLLSPLSLRIPTIPLIHLFFLSSSFLIFDGDSSYGFTTRIICGLLWSVEGSKGRCHANLMRTTNELSLLCSSGFWSGVAANWSTGVPTDTTCLPGRNSYRTISNSHIRLHQ